MLVSQVCAHFEGGERRSCRCLGSDASSPVVLPRFSSKLMTRLFKLVFVLKWWYCLAILQMQAKWSGLQDAPENSIRHKVHRQVLRCIFPLHPVVSRVLKICVCRCLSMFSDQG